VISHRDDPAGGADLSSEAKLDPLLEQQFTAGRLYATISSRPGQSGRADGYILEGKELEVSRCLIVAAVLTSVPQFYVRKLRTGKQKHAHNA
jgi:small subunit ribosomal protein S8e